ncbi:MAG: hypothetical protein GKR89_14720 [Candidatus Latescibacteria bacterium]|nr:hypothetical protein [Candidatus Latescibacterota bacterium]
MSGNGENDRMTTTDPVQAQRDYACGTVKLMVWHVWDLYHDPADGASIQENLDRRVDIMRKTALFDGRHPAGGLNPPIAEWDRLKEELAVLIQGVGAGEETGALEEDCWALLWPFVEPTLDQTRDKLTVSQERPYRCWSYEWNQQPSRSIGLHFSNAFQSDSPFGQRRDELIDDLRRLLEDAGRKHPQVERVTCGSWLNQFAPFNALFPASWEESFVPVYDYWATYGWWGQYMTHQGRFHRRNGNLFRRHRRHPFVAGVSSCSWKAALAHVQALGQT